MGKYPDALNHRLPAHAENVLLALEMARKEAMHLQYTRRARIAQPIDAAWVQQLTSRDDLADKIGARNLGNVLVHEYMSDTQLFRQALSSARVANLKRTTCCRGVLSTAPCDAKCWK